MSVFISYNHNDSDFAERLALELSRRDIKVWKDSWRIGVGDSLIRKVQDGLEDAHFFCVIFSKNSLSSEWVKREITAGLLREIEERKVLILPIVIDDCKLPLLIRDKLYADFRNDFEHGLKELLAVLVPYYRIQGSGRTTTDDHYYIDWGFFTEERDGSLTSEIDIVSFDLEESYSILTQIRFVGTHAATLEALGIKSPQEATDLILDACISEFTERPGKVVVSPGKRTTAHFTLVDEAGTLIFDAYTSIKIVGDMKRGAITFNVGAIFSQIDATKHS
ncbi:MAG: toll/interleukin-1 receptor domain-containing protein [Chloroflexota bacterium]